MVTGGWFRVDRGRTSPLPPRVPCARRGGLGCLRGFEGVAPAGSLTRGASPLPPRDSQPGESAARRITFLIFFLTRRGQRPLRAVAATASSGPKDESFRQGKESFARCRCRHCVPMRGLSEGTTPGLARDRQGRCEGGGGPSSERRGALAPDERLPCEQGRMAFRATTHPVCGELARPRPGPCGASRGTARALAGEAPCPCEGQPRPSRARPWALRGKTPTPCPQRHSPSGGTTWVVARKGGRRPPRGRPAFPSTPALLPRKALGRRARRHGSLLRRVAPKQRHATSDAYRGWIWSGRSRQFVGPFALLK